MKPTISRRSVLGRMAGSGAAAAAAVSLGGSLQAADEEGPGKLKGNINHSVCAWCYRGIKLEELCKVSKEIGIKSIDLMGPKQWPVLKEFGLTTAMANGAGMGIGRGFNDVENHDKLVQSYEEIIPLVAEAGLTNLICFSGNRNGISDEQGMANCAKGLKRLMKLAESKKVVLVMELLNSKVNHKGYQCDHTAWGAELCEMVGSESFKLLYDVYHLQIMEGDLIATIKKYAPYIAHYHTGGVPGRNEIDETQEIYYPAVMRAIVETGYKGFVAQEFIPKNADPIASLRQAIQICDV